MFTVHRPIRYYNNVDVIAEQNNLLDKIKLKDPLSPQLIELNYLEVSLASYTAFIHIKEGICAVCI